MLSTLALRDNYSSDDSNILEELVRPCLVSCAYYFRSVGFLDSKIIGLLGAEFESLAARGGQVRLLVGCTVSEAEYSAIKTGKLEPARFLIFPDLNSLWSKTVPSDSKNRGLLVISWLVARGNLQIKFSIRPRSLSDFLLIRTTTQTCRADLIVIS